MKARTTVVPILALAVGAVMLGAERENLLPRSAGDIAARLFAESWLRDSRTCSEVITAYKGSSAAINQTESTSPPIELRHVRVDDWAINNMGRGKWIGVVHSFSSSTAPSSLYPGLLPDKWGCLFMHFRKVKNKKPQYLASLMLEGEEEGTSLPNALICRHSVKHQNPLPKVDTFVDECPNGSSVWLTFRSPSGEPLTANFTMSAATLEADFKRAVEESLGGGLTTLTADARRALAEKLFRETNKAGAWFPCAETGCCRVWEE